MLWNSLKLRVVSGFNGVTKARAGRPGINTPVACGGEPVRRQAGWPEVLRRWHGLRVGRDRRRGKAQEWCNKLWMEVQMWKRHRNVEKRLNGGKTAGKGKNVES